MFGARWIPIPPTNVTSLKWMVGLDPNRPEVITLTSIQAQKEVRGQDPMLHEARGGHIILCVVRGNPNPGGEVENNSQLVSRML